MKILRNIIVLCFVCLVAACHPSDGAGNYLGRWEMTARSDMTLEIVRNGDNYLVKQTVPVLLQPGKFTTRSFPALMKDGMLQMQLEFTKVNIDYIQATDTLLVKNNEYKRVK